MRAYQPQYVEPPEQNGDRGLNFALEQVRQFHVTFGSPVGTNIEMMPRELVEQRVHFCAEELHELLNAEDVYDQIDAVIDLIYFCLGNLVILGVKDVQSLFNIVHKANMSKVWEDGLVRVDETNGNKIMKPPTWIDPKPLLIEEIKRQMESADKDE